MRYTEDQLTNALIQNFSANEHREVYCETEAHYNHFGNRGAADLFIREYALDDSGARESRNSIAERVFEIKSDYAIEQATGANEVIRQFNKMRRYFFKDEDRRSMLPRGNDPFNLPVFELAFLPSPTTLQHVIDNLHQYKSCDESDVGVGDTMLLFRLPTPDDMAPYHLSALWGKAGLDHVPDDSPYYEALDTSVEELLELPDTFLYEDL